MYHDPKLFAWHRECLLPATAIMQARRNVPGNQCKVIHLHRTGTTDTRFIKGTHHVTGLHRRRKLYVFAREGIHFFGANQFRLAFIKLVHFHPACIQHWLVAGSNYRIQD